MAMTGIFGGRFDPPHVGHDALARAAKKRFSLNHLIVTVVADPGHKRTDAPPGDRLAMARLAFAGLAAEVALEEHRFTVDALEAARYEDPVFLIGADQLAAFSTWKEPERVLELARLGVATRPGFKAEAGSARIVLFDLEPHEVSSTDVRLRVRRGQPIGGLVARAVAAYIAEHELYRDA